MTDHRKTTSSDPAPIVYAFGDPRTSLYPFPVKAAVAVLGRFVMALTRVLTFRRKQKLAVPIAAAHATQELGASSTTWEFRLCHIAGFVLSLPVVAAVRLLPSHWHKRHDESVFVETNRTVLTVLGLAFMASSA